MLYGNCQAGPLFGVVDALLVSTTVIYGVVIVSRNLERTNENDRFKMTALELGLVNRITVIN